MTAGERLLHGAHAGIIHKPGVSMHGKPRSPWIAFVPLMTASTKPDTPRPSPSLTLAVWLTPVTLPRSNAQVHKCGITRRQGPRHSPSGLIAELLHESQVRDEYSE